jgi:hypothetical protein
MGAGLQDGPDLLACLDCGHTQFLVMFGGGLPQPKLKCAQCGACWFAGRQPAPVPAVMDLLGQRVRVVLGEHVVAEGKLLGFGDGGDITLQEDDGMLWHGWPALEVAAALPPVSGPGPGRL